MSTMLETADEACVNLNQTEFNLAVWKRLLADPALAALDYRIETDVHGQMIMSPPPAPAHGGFQSEIARILGNWNSTGRVLTECPISTSEGVKAADVAWCSKEIWEEAKHEVCFVRCPEICVEVLSPSNTKGEIEEKKRLYFEAGAREFWTCSGDGTMHFFYAGSASTVADASLVYPDFPTKVE
ncbi:MAG: Uma2 family endonuclease [Verrucomicrobiales bacterium]